jgi:hypothetical protein
MTGGSLSLTATRGVGQDVININPQITFFKKVYKRHTNFGIEAIQQSLSSTPSFGSSTEIKISKSGSLITDMHFEFTLPPAAAGGGIDKNGASLNEETTAATGCVSNFKRYARWVNAVGFAIINEIQLKFGSTILDKHSGLWYDVWNELTDPNRKEWPLVGKYLDSTKQEYIEFRNTRYYVPLKFYFNRNPGLALPIFLLNENELKINLSFKSLESLLLYNIKVAGDTGGANTTVNSRSMSGFKFYVNYVFLEADEESRIQNSLPSEYLVETLDIKDNLTTSEVSNLVFENPTKELIWVFRHNDRIATGSTAAGSVPIFNSEQATNNNTNPNDIFNYSKATTNTNLGYGSKDPFSSLTIKINNKERFDRTDATFFRTMQPYKYHSNIPGGIANAPKKQFIYVYSFALNPEEYQPTGSYNFSIGDDLVSFEFQGPDDMASSYDLTIFALRYEYVVFNFGRITVSRVPIQSSFQEAQIGAAKDDAKVAKDDAKEKGKAKPVSVSSQKNAAVKQEIERRYAVEVPYIHNQSLGKKKWSGLQGNFFQKQQMADLDKEYESKKKDIF